MADIAVGVAEVWMVADIAKGAIQVVEFQAGAAGVPSPAGKVAAEEAVVAEVGSSTAGSMILVEGRSLMTAHVPVGEMVPTVFGRNIHHPPSWSSPKIWHDSHKTNKPLPETEYSSHSAKKCRC